MAEPIVELKIWMIWTFKRVRPSPVLKRFLGAQLGISRFCLKLMGEDSKETDDDTDLTSPADFLLVCMDVQLSDADTDEAFFLHVHRVLRLKFNAC